MRKRGRCEYSSAMNPFSLPRVIDADSVDIAASKIYYNRSPPKVMANHGMSNRRTSGDGSTNGFRKVAIGSGQMGLDTM